MTDKRALKRQYLETKIRSGVYTIRNLATGRAWVAGSANVQAALNRHRFELRLGQHRNAQLRRDWADHGEASFVFEVLDTVKHRDEPGFNPERELEALVSLWRQEIPCQGQQGYGDTEDER